MRLALVANLADAWATYGADRDLLNIAEDTAANARESVRLTRRGSLAVWRRAPTCARPKQILATAERFDRTAKDRAGAGRKSDPPARRRRRRSRVAAHEPGRSNARDPSCRGQLADPAPPPRCDRGEYGLRAANADIGVARAQLFPSISLTGLLGFASNALSSLFDSGSFSWSAGGDITAPIFDMAAAAPVAVSGQRDAALASYEGAIRPRFARSPMRWRCRARSPNGRVPPPRTPRPRPTRRCWPRPLQGGVDSFLASLDAQRSLYAARRSEIATQLLLVQTRIALFRALGAIAAPG